MGSPCRLSLLPGDGFEDAEADEQTEGGGEENSPGIGGEAKGGTGGRGGHDGVSLEETLRTRCSVGLNAMEFLEKGKRAEGTSYNNNRGT